MDSKDKRVNLKQLAKETMVTDKVKAVSSSIEAEKSKFGQAVSSSIEAEKSKADTSSIPTDQMKENENKAKSIQDNGKLYDSINKINRKKEIWRLGVIIDDIWTVYKSGKEDHIDMLLRDIKGDTIQATINDHEIKEWSGKLAEGKTYNMCNFKVHDNVNGFKYSSHKFKLAFVGATIVKEIDNFGIPLTAFKFMDFQSVSAGKFSPDQLVDAIGVIDSLKKYVQATATKKANVGFTIKDLRGNIFDCTLWDDLCGQFLTFYNGRTDDGPAVIIIKNARLKQAQDVYPIQISNVWNGTKLLFDPQIPDIKAFINSLPKDATYPTQQFSSSYSTQYQSQTSGASQLTPDEKFIKQGQVLDVGEIKKQKSDTYCVTVATTSHILVNNTGWYFRGCLECPCKADGNEPPFICRNKHKTDNPTIKYKLDVQVENGDDYAKFVFWDNTLDELVGMNAATLLQREIEDGRGDPQEYPRALDDIMERKFAFRVKWSPSFGGQASVLEVKDSPGLIERIEEHLPVAESQCNEIVEIQDEDVVLTESPPTQNFTQDDIDKFASLDDSILSTPNFSTSSNKEISESSQKSTGKRAATKPISVENTNLETQFSSTRSGKLIKKEKL